MAKKTKPAAKKATAKPTKTTREVERTDYSHGEYVNLNSLDKNSTPLRAIEFENEDGDLETHLVDITTHPADLLPG